MNSVAGQGDLTFRGLGGIFIVMKSTFSVWQRQVGSVPENALERGSLGQSDA
jgi:hypothetical protein